MYHIEGIETATYLYLPKWLDHPPPPATFQNNWEHHWMKYIMHYYI